jgi:hypothetical protein
MEQRAGYVAATDAEIDAILAGTRYIAVVGLSKDPGKASHRVAVYLQGAGYVIVPVNPTASDKILGEKAYRRLADITGRLDLVDVFRPAPDALEIVRETAERGVPVIWFQVGCANDEAIREAVRDGLCVVHDRCMMVEHRRYLQHTSR